MSTTSAVLALAREREVKALQMRIEGNTYERIAEALGMTRGGAHQAVVRRLRQLDALAEGEAEHLRRIEAERLLWEMRCLVPKVDAGEVAACREYRECSESLRKLWGLDAPTKTTQDGAVTLSVVYGEPGPNDPAE